ncbi:MAG: hypothetical protein ACLQLC_10455 [Candidatus Sulfotelmatobacter sp.]
MRNCRILNFVVLCLLSASAALICVQLGYAQDEKQQDAKPAQQEEPKNQARPDDAKPARPDEAKPSKQDDKQDMKPQSAQEQQDHPEQSADRGREGQDTRTQTAQAHPGGKGGHIPDDKFKAHFGRSHTFTAKTVIVQGQPQFSYGGYSFELVDAWPVGWAYTDECYIDYIDGEYFLFDLLHPGVRVAVFVVL